MPKNRLISGTSRLYHTFDLGLSGMSQESGFSTRGLEEQKGSRIMRASYSGSASQHRNDTARLWCSYRADQPFSRSVIRKNRRKTAMESKDRERMRRDAGPAFYERAQGQLHLVDREFDPISMPCQHPLEAIVEELSDRLHQLRAVPDQPARGSQ